MTQNQPFVEPVEPLAMKLTHMPLLFGIMEEMNLAGLVNEKIPKVGPHVRIQSGSLFRIFCARFLSGDMPGGINSLQQFACSLPASFLGVKAELGENPYKMVNKDVAGDLLDRIAEYGPARFQSELMSSLIDTNSVEIAHLDSTSYHVHGQPQYNEGKVSSNENQQGASHLLELSNKQVRIAQVSSRDNRPVLPQVNHLGVSAMVEGMETGVLLYQAAFDGNMDDTTRFQQFCSDGELSYLKETYPNLKVLVGDAALASAKAIHACHNNGIEMVTRLQNSKVKRDLIDMNQGKLKLSSIELPVPEWEKKGAQPQVVQYAWLEPACIKTQDKSEVFVQRILFVAESMRARKTVALRAKAEKELQEVRATLNKLRTSPKSCEPDAIKEFNTLKSKLKLVTISNPEYEKVMGYATTGRPKAGADKSVIAVRVIANASINEAALEDAIKLELYYVLATTNMQLKHTDKEALELYKTYHGQAQIESQWKDIKATGTFFDSIYLKSPERMKALLAVVSIALFVGRVLMTHVRTVLKDRSLTLPSDNTPASARPSLKTFIRFATSDRAGSFMMVSPDFVLIPKAISKSILYLVAMEIGEHATRLYSKEFYTHDREYIYTALEKSREMYEIEDENFLIQ